MYPPFFVTIEPIELKLGVMVKQIICVLLFSNKDNQKEKICILKY